VAINYYLTRINEARGKSERAYINHLLSFNPIDCVANCETHERNGVEKKKKKRCVRTTNVFDFHERKFNVKIKKNYSGLQQASLSVFTYSSKIEESFKINGENNEIYLYVINYL